MQDDNSSLLKKILLIIIYLCIIILIPLFLDYLFKLTVRKKRKAQIKELAEEKAKNLNKSLIIFNDRYHGVVRNINENTKENFTGDIEEIIPQLADNSAIIVVSDTLEYVDNIKPLIEQLRRASADGNLYLINIEKNSPRVFWDYKIINIMDKSYYLPDSEEIKWVSPNNLQKKSQKFYSYVFKIIPYRFFDGAPVEK